MQFRHDQSFPIFHQDQLDIYELYIILKRRGRLETVRLDTDLVSSKKIREVANTIDIEQGIVGWRTCRPEDYGLQ